LTGVFTADLAGVLEADFTGGFGADFEAGLPAGLAADLAAGLDGFFTSAFLLDFAMERAPSSKQETPTNERPVSLKNR
jgi:hypothetical protein